MPAHFKYDWSDKEQFIRDLKKSYNMSDFLKRQNLTATPSNFQTFKKKTLLHDIDPSSFFLVKEKRISKLNYLEKIPDEKIFCLNSGYDRDYTRKRLRKNNLLAYCCAICNNPGLWQNKPLTLQVEHKNGNNLDNRLENLEYLCPNCHTQTPTYGSKNKHNKLFNKRVEDLLTFKELNEKAMDELCVMWRIEHISLKDWLKNYKEKLSELNITIDISLIGCSKSSAIKKILHTAYENNWTLKELEKNLSVSQEKVKIFSEIYHMPLYKKIFLKQPEEKIEINEQFIKKKADIRLFSIENIVLGLSKKWKESEEQVITFIKHNDYSVYTQIKVFEKKLKRTNAFIEENNKIIQEQELLNLRLPEVKKLKNKKEVLSLSKKWGVSVNGAKKWIRNNVPLVFKEIYDDKHLEHVKKEAEKNKIENFIYNSKPDNFNIEKFMLEHNVSRHSALMTIKNYNKQLFEYLSYKKQCPECNSHMRTSGKSGKSPGLLKQIYRCLNKDCQKLHYELIT